MDDRHEALVQLLALRSLRFTKVAEMDQSREFRALDELCHFLAQLESIHQWHRDVGNYDGEVVPRVGGNLSVCVNSVNCYGDKEFSA